MKRTRINSRQKGARGERQWRDELRANGYVARRGQQFSGSPESPDVVSPALPWAHFEVKFVERFNIYDAMEQALRDCEGQSRNQKTESKKEAVVAHRRNDRRWLVVMTSETFFKLVRGDFAREARAACSGAQAPDGDRVERVPTAERIAAGDVCLQPGTEKQT